MPEPNPNSVIVPSLISGDSTAVKIPQIEAGRWDIVPDGQVRGWMSIYFDSIYDTNKTTEENIENIIAYLRACIKHLSDGIAQISAYIPYLNAILKLKILDPTDSVENT